MCRASICPISCAGFSRDGGQTGGLKQRRQDSTSRNTLQPDAYLDIVEATSFPPEKGTAEYDIRADIDTI